MWTDKTFGNGLVNTKEKQRWACNYFFLSPKIANPQILGSFRKHKFANFIGGSVRKSANLYDKSTNFFVISVYCANRKSAYFSPYIGKRHTSLKKVRPLVRHFMTIPPNIQPEVCSLKFFTVFKTNLNHSILCLLFVRRKIMFCWFAIDLSLQMKLGPQIGNPQITNNIGSTNSKSANCHLCRR